MTNDPRALTIKRDPVGQNPQDYSVLENGGGVGRIFTVPTAPEGRPWDWASSHNGEIRRAAHGYEPTRERRWPRSLRVGAEARVHARLRCRPRRRGDTSVLRASPSRKVPYVQALVT